jgi:hypothetical protein
LNNLKTPGLEVKEIFNRTGAEVLIASDRKQIPAVYSQFFGSAYFSKPLVVPTPEAPHTAVAPIQPTEMSETSTTPVASSVFFNPSSAVASGNISESSAGVTFTSVADLGGWLYSRTDNTVRTPYNVKLNVSNLNGIKDVLSDTPKKYVYLDLSGSTFTSIELYDFWRCTNLISVIIPFGVTSIGGDAFRECTSLDSVIIPNSVKSIGDNAFRYCTSLTNVTIGSGITSIGDNAFNECTSLASIIIPRGITSIGMRAFAYCKSLASVTFQGNIPSSGFYSGVFSTFPGDLRKKFYAIDSANGTQGTYTRKNGSSTWTRL